jgi:hypothetical protein
MKKLVPYIALAVVLWQVYERFQGNEPPEFFRSRWHLQLAAFPWIGLLFLIGMALIVLAWIFARLFVLWRRRRERSWDLTSVSDRIRVHGWTASQLRAIAKDFAQRHDLPPRFAALTPEDQLVSSLWFPSRLPVGLLLKFIAYLHSPGRFEIRNELQAESLHAIGHVTITPAFRLPDESLIGQRGLLYTPAGEYVPQLVFMAVAPDRFFEFSLRTSTWERRYDPRMNSWVRKLWGEEIAGQRKAPAAASAYSESG